jgi:hypothetical protein
MNSMDTNRKILLFVMMGIIIFAIFYWSYTVNRERLQKLNSQVLITENTDIKNTKSKEVTVNRSSSNALSFSFWLNIRSMTPTAVAGMNVVLNVNEYIIVGVDSTTNNLVIQFRKPTPTSTGNYQVVLENIPFYTWNHYSITVNGRYINIYVNGELVQSSLIDSPLVPAGNSYVVSLGDTTSNSTFNATIANCYYFSYILNYNQVVILSNTVPKIKQ